MAPKKKNFTENLNSIEATIANATAEPVEEPAAQDIQDAQDISTMRKERKTYNAQEMQEYMSARKTGGRKGMKLPRINLAFSPEVYDYVRTMSKVSGQTMTDFVNHIVEQSYNDNKEIYKKAVEFRNSL